jgi:hypothetical protein
MVWAREGVSPIANRIVLAVLILFGFIPLISFVAEVPQHQLCRAKASTSGYRSSVPRLTKRSPGGRIGLARSSQGKDNPGDNNRSSANGTFWAVWIFKYL